MKRLALVTAVLLGGTAAAHADPCTISYDATNPTYAPDDSVITLLFDAFGAAVSNPGTCAPSFNAHQNTPNDPDVFEVYTPTSAATSCPTPTTRGRSPSRPMAAPPRATFVSGDNPLLTHFIGKDANGKLRSNIKVEITNATDPATEAFIDSVDYALAGTMTRNQAEASLTGLGNAETALVTHLDATSGLLTGGKHDFRGTERSARARRRSAPSCWAAMCATTSPKASAFWPACR